MLDWMSLRWTALVTRGLAGVVFGVVAMAWPEETVLVVVVLWGCWALVDGILALGAAWSSPGAAAKVLLLLTGVVALAVAVFAIARPGVAAVTITWVLGAWLLLRGLLEVVEGFGAQGNLRWMLMVTGVLDGLIGALFLANPGSAALSVTVLLGLLALLWGCAAVVMALLLRNESTGSRAHAVPDGALG